MNNIQKNSILYYADFLSLSNISIPVTDNCKYYIIHNMPINCAYIVGGKPFYDEQNQYYIQSCKECEDILNYAGEDGLNSFLTNMCNLQSLGCITAKQMLQCINQFKYKKDVKQSNKIYEDWYNNRVYYHTVKDDDGEQHREKCSEYVARAEQGTWKNPTFNYEGSIIQP